MENYDDIYTELKNSTPLLSEMKKENSYDLPKDYFLHFSRSINEQIRKGGVYMELAEVVPLLAKLEKPNLEKISEAYFSKLPEILLERIRNTEVSEEIKVVAPAIASLEKENLYKVPTAYFKENSLRILEAIQKREKNKTKQPNVGWIMVLENITAAIRNVLDQPKYALAFAGCLGFLMFSSIFFLNSDASDEQKIVAQLRGINDDEINNFIAMNIDEIQEHHILQNSNEVDFSSFLENTKEVNSNVEEYILSGIDEDAIGKELID